MSDVEPEIDINSQLINALNDEGVDEPVEQSQPEVVEELPPLTDFGQRYLATVPDEEREIAERHVRRWDAGYAKQAERWKSYESLGTPEDLGNYRSLYNTFVTAPEKIVEYLQTQGYTLVQAQQAVAEAQQTPAEVNPSDEKLTKLEKAVEYLVTTRQQETAAQQEARQIEEFNKALEASLPQGSTPEFRDVVIRLVAAGMPTIEAAVQQVQSLMQTSVNQNARQQAPTLLGSSGAPPVAKKKDVTELSDQEAKDYLAHLLQQG